MGQLIHLKVAMISNDLMKQKKSQVVKLKIKISVRDK